MKNKAAQQTGRKAKGVPKNYTPEELATRKERLRLARAKRWVKGKPAKALGMILELVTTET